MYLHRYALKNDQKDKSKKTTSRHVEQGPQGHKDTGTLRPQGHKDTPGTHRHPTIPPKRKSTSSPVQKKRPWWMNDKVKEEHGKGIR